MEHNTRMLKTALKLRKVADMLLDYAGGDNNKVVECFIGFAIGFARGKGWSKKDIKLSFNKTLAEVEAAFPFV